MGGALLFTGCATSIEDDRLPPGAYVPPAPKQNPPPKGNTDPGKVDDIVSVQPQTFITPANEQLPPPPPKKIEKKAKADKKVIHVVQKGDSFWKLASMYGVTVKEIMDANPGVTPNKIYPGKKIVIPAASGKKAVSSKASAKKRKNDKKAVSKADKKVKKTTVKASAPGERYTVRKGDSFGKIAAKYKIKAADLAAANKLSLEKPLWIGQVLIIPQNAVKAAKANKKNAAPASAKGRKTAAKTQKAAAKKAKAAPAKATPVPEAANKGNEPLPPAPEKSSASKDSLPPAPVAPPDLSDLNEQPAAPQKNAESASEAKPLPAQTTDRINDDISIEEYSKKVGFSVESLKQYNPNLPADGIIRAGTVVNLP